MPPPFAPALRIKRLLLDSGRTVSDLAETLEATRPMVSQVIHGHAPSPRLRRLIAAELGTSYLEVWGEEDPGVDRLPPGRAPKSLTLVSQIATSEDGATS